MIRMIMCFLAGAVWVFGAPAAPAEVADIIYGELILLNDNGAWCWYQDDRVFIDEQTGVMLVGSVAASQGAGGDDRGGDVDLVSYSLKKGSRVRFTLHENLEQDDHDVPAILKRPDGRYLAMYTKHNTDKLTRYRISSRPHDGTEWQEEKVFDWGPHIGPNNATYSNLHYLSDEKRLYNFVRAVNRDHCVITSDDMGETWTYRGKLTTVGNVGYVNGYVRYASNGKDTIHLISTDHHPRNYNNNIYHAYIKNGKIHHSDGTVVDENLFDAEAVRPADLTRVFKAGSEFDGEPMSRAWTTDIEIDDQGNPYIIFNTRANDVPADSNIDDHRFFYARWDGTQWNVHQVAKAGPKLWRSEQDYTGLVALHPNNPDLLYMSTPIDPRTDRATGHHEIYRGRTTDKGKTWTWTPITENSSVDNLRPVVPRWRGDQTALLWFRGTMKRSQDYDCSIVGVILEE